MQSSTLSDQLHQWLAGHGHASCHLLFDPMLRPLEEDSELAIALSAAEAAGCASAKHAIRLPIDAQACPWVSRLDVDKSSSSHAITLSLQEAVSELDPTKLRAGLGRRIGGWLVSDAKPQTIAAHLAHTMVLEHGGQRMLLRLHDSAVMWPLFHMLTSEQRTAMLGPIKHWWLLDPAGHLACLDNPRALTDASRSTAPSGSLCLSSEQWADVLRFNSLNATLNQWLEAMAAPPDADSMAGARTAALAALRRASTYGLSETDDLTLFALHALRIAPVFDSHKLVQALLVRCNATQNAQPESFSAVIEELGPDDWARIRNEAMT
jgi:Domain of unknown function (DUF4123)